MTSPSIWICLLIVFDLFFTGCTPRQAHIDRSAIEKISWPGLPEKPRITYLWSITADRSMSLDSAVALDNLNVAPEIVRPYNIFVDEQDFLYVSDQGANMAYAVDQKNGELGMLDTDSAGVDMPLGIVVYDGSLYISYPLLKKVIILDRTGRRKGEFRGEFSRPTSLALDRKGKSVYVSDTPAHKVYRYDLDGNLLGMIGRHGSGAGEFNFPSHLWVDKDGLLYVTDSMNFRVQVFSSNGQFQHMFGALGDAYGELDKPKGVASDSEGNIYVVDSIKDVVKIFNREGRLLLFWGGQGRDLGQFYLPSGIFIDANDRIYVADTYNSRIQVFKYLGAK